MDMVAAMAPPPALDETDSLLAEVNLFLQKSRERANAPTARPSTTEPGYKSAEIRSWEICEAPAVHEPDEIDEPREYREIDEPLEIEGEPREASITKRQFRALKRKHLLIMMRDLERELRLVKNEKAELLLAYQAGCGPERQRIE